jgi:hypothetical protein
VQRVTFTPNVLPAYLRTTQANHHNPTPGLGDGDWLYGHNWVCLAMLTSHPLFGIIALPLLSLLYVRKVDQRYEWEFRTKHELALDLCRHVMRTLLALGSQADRWGIEEHFHDVKEIRGAGEQQVHSVCSSIGCWN